MELSRISSVIDPTGALMRSVKAGRFSHAVLLAGPAGTGKRTAARYLAQACLCTGEERPCGSCPSCKKVLASRLDEMHPDLHIIEGEGSSIRVDEIRALRETISVRPSGKRHAVIIQHSDRMTLQAQNALLKTLEEPSGDCVIFLTADHPDALLPTVLSRLRTVRFAPLSIPDCARIVREKCPDSVPADPEQAAVYAGGNVGRALKIAADPGYIAARREVLESLLSLRTGKGSVSGALHRLRNVIRDRPEDLTEILEVLARDQMRSENDPSFPRRDVSLPWSGRMLLEDLMDLKQARQANLPLNELLGTWFLKLAGMCTPDAR